VLNQRIKLAETGLGWSLLAGGTITRTVRGGVADELIESTFMSDPPSEKYGIYKHENNPTYKLIFNQLTNWDLKEYAFYAAKGRYDTEYDLYQYNFMGYSGRFIIKRDPNGNFVVEKLDRNNLKITSIHSPGGEVQTITIIDDKGTVSIPWNGKFIKKCEHCENRAGRRKWRVCNQSWRRSLLYSLSSGKG
jgi:hypothetical protein